MATLAAAQSQEAVRQDAALQERVELVLDEPQQPRTGAGLGVRDEAGRMLLHDPMQHGLLRSVARAVQRHTIGRVRCRVIAAGTVMAGAGHAAAPGVQLQGVGVCPDLRTRRRGETRRDETRRDEAPGLLPHPLPARIPFHRDAGALLGWITAIRGQTDPDHDLTFVVAGR